MPQHDCIHMIKSYDDSIWKSAKLVFRLYLGNEIYPFELKKANLVPVHREEYI